VMQAAPKGQVPPDLKIISVKKFTHEQRHALCGSCHAKTSPLTTSFPPGERFFDHFDLVTLENPDYYPDGRDLGENYTYTTWLLSPCAKSGQLDCVKCHTSSGALPLYRRSQGQRRLPPLPRQTSGQGRRARSSPDGQGWRAHQVCPMPYAHDRLCPHEPERPLHAAAGPGRHQTVRLAQRLQLLS
jgi:hypothetical protein